MSDALLRLIMPLRKAEQVLLICRDALPGVLAAIRSLERTIQAGDTEGQQTAGQQSEGQHTEQMGLGL
jgi:hypothetical protein